MTKLSTNHGLRIGGVGIMEFGVLGGGQNIFYFGDGGLPYEDRVIFQRGGQFILCQFSYFQMKDSKNSKKNCLWDPHFQYSHFQF